MKFKTIRMLQFGGKNQIPGKDLDLIITIVKFVNLIFILV